MTDKARHNGRTYRDSGVDIDRGNAAVRRIRALGGTGSLGKIGGFAAGFPFAGETLLSGADGVGSKVLIAQNMRVHDTIGIDLVAMNVNDVLASGGRPLFFLDYIGIGRIDENLVADLVQGMLEGCRQANCALVGGETAELPDLYAPGIYDLAGFAVGVQTFLPRRRPEIGDRLIGLGSSGLHSNGFSLVRQVLLEDAAWSLEDPVPASGWDSAPLGSHLLTPTRIYVEPVTRAWESFEVLAMAHITGGGLLENVPRVLDDGLGVDLDLAAWPLPPVFQLLREMGPITDGELLRTFNCGIGFVVIVAPRVVDQALGYFRQQGLDVYDIGEVAGSPGVRWKGVWR